MGTFYIAEIESLWDWMDKNGMDLQLASAAELPAYSANGAPVHEYQATSIVEGKAQAFDDQFSADGTLSWFVP